MSAYEIERPLWRRFKPQFLKRAAAHVRAGGHAVIAPDDGRLEMILTVEKPTKRTKVTAASKGKAAKKPVARPARVKTTELAQWTLLALNMRRWRTIPDGPAKGLATARVPVDYEGSVLDWCDRDAVHEGTTRTIKLDCLECGACCHEANVLLDDLDFKRWRDGGRGDLVSRAYIKRARDGRVTLRFLDNGNCQHLGGDNKCAIYPIRPDNCSVFVVGSEACLAAREDTLRLRDG